MEKITNLKIKAKYATYSDDLINDFYIPVLSNSISYKRAVGYFSSSALIEYAKGLKTFIKNKGKMKLLMSPFLYGNDYNQIKDAFNEDHLLNNIESIFQSYLDADQYSKISAKILFYLIKLGYLQIKIAIPRNHRGIFHEKIAVFEDYEGNKLVISGSNNETQNAFTFNSESFSAFCSWKTGQLEYVAIHEYDFDYLWEDKNSNVIVRDVKYALSNKILTQLNTNESLENLFKELDGFISVTGTNQPSNFDSDNLPFKLYSYQSDAIEKWRANNNLGIFKFATGSGKTKTAIKLVSDIQREGNQFTIIVVPDKTLNHQWAFELREYNWSIIQCFSDNDSWLVQIKDQIDVGLIDKSRKLNIVVTLDTFFGERFQQQLKKLKNNYLLVVDECHTWGTNAILSKLPNASMKLGLSATPELHFSAIKTHKLLEYFGGIVSKYSIEDAMNEDKLVRYNYYPIIISLNEIEREQYKNLTQKIIKSLGYDPGEMGDPEKNPFLEQLLFKRSRIIYGANNKLKKLVDLVNNLKNNGSLKNLLIYCGATSYNEDYSKDVNDDAQTQIEKVNALLNKEGIIFAQYTSKENEFEKKAALDAFKNGTYATLVAIRCLDEGVNIPQVERAIILSSSTNPREFIQRRGRILRPHQGKKQSEIYDFIVLDKEYKSLNKKELERFFEFARISINQVENIEFYDKLISEYGGNIHG